MGFLGSSLREGKKCKERREETQGSGDLSPKEEFLLTEKDDQSRDAPDLPILITDLDLACILKKAVIESIISAG